MAITKRPVAKTTTTPKSVDNFISAAPDASLPADARKGVMRGKREQISHTMPPVLLDRLNAKVEATGMTRAGLINQAIAKYLDSENA